MDGGSEGEGLDERCIGGEGQKQFVVREAGGVGEFGEEVDQVAVGIETVHLCGFDTDCCILATTYDLFDQNIKPVILENLTWSTSKEKLHGAAIKIIKRNIGFAQNV